MCRTAFRTGRYFALGAVVLMGLAHRASGAELHVPSAFETIQAAIETAVDGDHVVLAPGTYFEALDLLGKKITLRSLTGSVATVLDGERHDTSIITANKGESLETRVEGLTFRNGSGRFTSACQLSGHLGGAVFVKDGGISIIDSIFENNGRFDPDERKRSINGGGAVYACEADIRISSSRFVNNIANWGGAIRFKAVDKDALLTDNRFLNNSSAFGGAISSEQELQATLRISGSHFDGNQAGSNGGGVSLRAADRATVSISSSSFRTSAAAFGGGAFLWALDRGKIELLDVDFIDNDSAFGGGAFIWAHGQLPAVTGGRVKIVNSRFLGNTAQECCNAGKYQDSCFADGRTEGELWSGAGADIRTGFGGIVDVVNSLFARNSGVRGGGAHVGSCNGGIVNFVNNTIVENQPSGLHLRLDMLDLTGRSGVGEIHVANSIVRGNLGEQIPLELLASLPMSTVTFSNVEGGAAGVGNVDLPPRFVNGDRCDYQLAPGSPGIDAGANEALGEAYLTDLSGRPRFVDDPDVIDTGTGSAGIVDMGAYERQMYQSQASRIRRGARPGYAPICPELPE